MTARRINLTVLHLWTFTSLLWIIVSIYMMVQVSSMKSNAIHETSTVSGLLQASSIPFLYGVIMFALSCLGHLSQHYKVNPTLATHFNAERVYLLFVASMVSTIIMEVVGISIVSGLISQSLNDPSTGNNLEVLYSFVFNALYFISATGETNAVDPSSFWKWVHTNCPASLSKGNCYREFYFSVTNCKADVVTCNTQGGLGYACPYYICRPQALRFSSESLLAISLSTIWFLAIHFISLTCSCTTLKEVRSVQITSVHISHETINNIIRRPKPVRAHQRSPQRVSHPHMFKFPEDDSPRSSSPASSAGDPRIFSDEENSVPENRNNGTFTAEEIFPPREIKVRFADADTIIPSVTRSYSDDSFNEPDLTTRVISVRDAKNSLLIGEGSGEGVNLKRKRWFWW